MIHVYNLVSQIVRDGILRGRDFAFRARAKPYESTRFRVRTQTFCKTRISYLDYSLCPHLPRNSDY